MNENTITVPKEWFEGLEKRGTELENSTSIGETRECISALLAYIESAKSLIK